jgi:hypothetical protein
MIRRDLETDFFHFGRNAIKQHTLLASLGPRIAMSDELRSDDGQRGKHASQADSASHRASALPPRALALELGDSFVLRLASICDLCDQPVGSNARADVERRSVEHFP